MADESSRSLILGTAGHIDHGKSRLVRALTGVDPDRLPEEQARGMTIELGFAHLALPAGALGAQRPARPLNLYFVDVPGHERFLRNMVAGATGIDAALLVVAADDSVMPQTREHAEVLRLLGVTRCVVALTKMDLVDDDWADAVELEIRDLLDALQITPSAVVRTSAATGAGLDALRVALVALAEDASVVDSAAETRPNFTWFRLPIDRVFTIAGRGTVVTGSVRHGGVRKDDPLELLPAGGTVRARDLQAHHEAQDAAAGRQRLAINLAGIERDAVARGDELATPGYLAPSRVLDVELAWLSLPGKRRATRMRLRLHLATRETRCELRLAHAPAEGSIREVFAQLRVDDPVVATWGQRFILRDDAATRTLGGGVILRPASWPWTTRRPAADERLAQLRDGDEKQRLAAAIADCAWNPATPAQLAARAGVADDVAVARLVRELGGARRVVALEAGGSSAILSRALLEATGATLRERLQAWLAERPRSPGVALREWPTWMPRACPARLRPALANWLLQNRAGCVLSEGHVLPEGHAAALTPEDRRLLDEALAAIRSGGLQPPLLTELPQYGDATAQRLTELIDFATAGGQLVRLGERLWLATEHWNAAIQTVAAALQREPAGLTVAALRDLLGTTRKYMVPLAEQLDRAGITRRRGDLRLAGPNLTAE